MFLGLGIRKFYKPERDLKVIVHPKIGRGKNFAVAPAYPVESVMEGRRFPHRFLRLLANLLR